MTKRLAVLCPTFLALCLGCGAGTEVNGEVNGQELAASDAVFVEEGDATTPARRIVIADEGDLCGLLRSGETPEGMTSLEIRIVGLGGEDAEFPIGADQAPYSEAVFAKDGDPSVTARAAAGEVVTGTSDEETVEAEFDLDFGDAGSLDGTVTAERCDLDAE